MRRQLGRGAHVVRLVQVTRQVLGARSSAVGAVAAGAAGCGPGMVRVLTVLNRVTPQPAFLAFK